MISDRAATVVVYVVTAMWAANLLAGMFAINGYQPSESVNGIFTGTVGVAFLIRAKAKSGDGGGEK